MRNKKVFKYGLALATLVPMLAFSVAMAIESEEGEMEENKTRVETKMGEVKQNMTEMRATRVANMKKLMENQINRADRIVTKLDSVLEKIESRRDKLDTDGTDLSSVDSLIAKVEAQQDLVETALDKAKTDLAALEGATEPGTSVRTFMKSMMDLKKKLIELHRLMMATLKEMRTASTNN